MLSVQSNDASYKICDKLSHYALRTNKYNRLNKKLASGATYILLSFHKLFGDGIERRDLLRVLAEETIDVVLEH